MPQTAHSAPAASGHIPDIATGGLCAWRLPADPSCAAAGRTLVRVAATVLGLDGDLLDAAALCASELVTNALQHGLRAGPGAPVVQPELWVWARAAPAPQLVVGVFDACRSSWPDTGPRDLLDEHGKGIGIVAAVADAWGVHHSRSRLALAPSEGQLPGKAVWCAFNLNTTWPDAGMTAPAEAAAGHLAAALRERGIARVEHRHERDVSLVSVPLAGSTEISVWVEPRAFTFTDRDHTRVRRPLIDFHDLAEHLVRRVEETLVGNCNCCKEPTG